MSDRVTLRFAACLAVALAPTGILGCSLETSVPGFGGSEFGPCTSDATVETSTVVISGGLLAPRCIAVPSGASVLVVNEDPLTYLFVESLSRSGPNVEVPGNGSATTEPITRAMFYESFLLPGAYLSITPR